MSILLNQDTRLMVQGITGRDGTFHAAKMKSYGTNIVAGTSPGKGGATIHDIPVYNTVEECVRLAKANTSILFVPAPHAKDAMLEAINAGVTLLICITEGIPTLDMVQIMSYAQLKGAKIIGPNCPGIISPNRCLAGIMP
ncbi:MAG: succinate--CoA ligase subunit alpha, partial [Bacteroidales bacterium]